MRKRPKGAHRISIHQRNTDQCMRLKCLQRGDHKTYIIAMFCFDFHHHEEANLEMLDLRQTLI